MEDDRKPLVLLHGEIKTPPLSRDARREVGWLLGRLQDGERLGMPRSRPMPSVGRRCHELRVPDGAKNWRVIYRIDDDAICVAAVFPKTTAKTPLRIIHDCQRRLRLHDEAAGLADKKRGG
jgi:phage-related protein